MILDPFLDTELDEDYLAQAAETMKRNGVSQSEVDEMRNLVGTRMRILTFHTWEWVYYGLFDVLTQMSPLTFTTGWSFEDFYVHALALADRGKAEPATADDLRQFFLTE
jgi:hypothetical protein